MTINFRKLDKLIVDCVSGSHKSPIYDDACREEANRLGREHDEDGLIYIARRLQELRNRGSIAYLERAEASKGNTGWYVTKRKRGKAACP